VNTVAAIAQDPDDLLASDAFGAGAKVRFETSADQVSWSEFTSVVIVSGTTRYEVHHLAGSRLSYYRTRYSKASPAVAQDYSDYSPTFQAGQAAGWTSLDRVRTRTGIVPTDTTDDANLQTFVDAVNEEMTRQVTLFLGPSSDTVRKYNVLSRSFTRALYIPGGPRSCTLLEIARYTTAAFETVNGAEYVLLPLPGYQDPGLSGA
jgi:hypothetical protein